jgi:glutamyl-Q tRNA(Asp) synthetase
MASATTATDNGSTAQVGPAYVGRFAPSPTGRLHLGSLTTAAASYLEAARHQGHWLLRIEDLDTPRIQPGASADMLRTLEALGFQWSGPVVYQSRRAEAYRAALRRLGDLGHSYACSCSRRQIGEMEADGVYPGTCRNGPKGTKPWAIRHRVSDNARVAIDDVLQGMREWRLGDVGDPVIQRRDGIVAYQLAVVVDDAASGVTDVVRGEDLLASTPWQLALQRDLGLHQLRYVHLPLVTAADGSKLSKSASALPLGLGTTAGAPRASRWLIEALRLLQLDPPSELATAPVATIWQWAQQNWRLTSLQSVRQLPHSGELTI